MSVVNSDSTGTVTVQRINKDRLLVRMRCVTEDGLRGDFAREVVRGDPDFECFEEKLTEK